MGRELEDGAPVVAGAQRRQQHLDGARRLRFVAGQRLQTGPRPRVARVGDERARVGRQGRVGRPQLFAVHVAELTQQLRARRVVGRASGPALQQRGELAPAQGRPQQRGQRQRRVVRLAELALHLAPRRDGLLRPRQRLAQQLGHAHAVGAPSIGARRRPGAQLQHLCQSLRVPATIEQLDQPVERLGVALVRRPARHTRLPQRDGAFVLPEPRGEPGGAPQGLSPRSRVLGGLGDALDDVEPLLVAPRRLEQRLRLLRGREPLGARRAGRRQHRGQETDGSRRVADAIGPHGGRLHRQGDRAASPSRTRRRPPPAGPPGARGARCARRARRARRAAARRPGRRPPRGPPARARSRSRRASRRAPPSCRCRFTRSGRGPHRFELDQQHARQVGVASGLRVVRVQPAGRALAHRCLRRRRRLGLAPPARPRRVRRRRGRVRRATRVRRRGRGGEHALQQPPDVRRGPVGAVLRSQQHGLDGLERRARIPQLVQPEPRDARARPPRLVALERGQARRQERDELAVLALPLVETLERAGRAWLSPGRSSWSCSR